MSKEVIALSIKEIERLRVVHKVMDKQIRQVDGARLLDISDRQVRNIIEKIKVDGDKGIAHGNRGREAANKMPKEQEDRIGKIVEEHYWDFGPTLASEKLLKHEGIKISHEKLRQIMIEQGLWKVRKRRDGPVYQWRERKAYIGEMVQLDGSHHRWFEERSEDYSCLMSMVDDATKTTYAFLAEGETTEAAMRLLWGWIERYGIPLSLYCDRKNAYVVDREPTLEEQLEGIEPMTAFGKACEKLGIEIITARSPQAKGRVERSHGVFQDRFVKELRLQDISNIEEANKVLANGFVGDLNRRFTIDAIDPKDAHVKIHKKVDLRTIFCFEDTRTVSNDWVIRYSNRLFQLLRDKSMDIRPKIKVLVAQWLDGSIHIIQHKKEVPNVEITKS